VQPIRRLNHRSSTPKWFAKASFQRADRLKGTHVRHFDSIIIGSGQAAPALAAGLARRGEKVALVEGRQLGGTCINSGCTPTKTLRKSARVAHLARRAADFGVLTGPVEVDFAAVMARMRERVEASRSGLVGWLDGIVGVDVINGWGHFERRNEHGQFVIGVGDEQVTAANVYLNTGTRAFVPEIPGLEDIPYLDNASILALNERPGHLIIMGGSYIGIEFGQIFRRLGSQVTMVYRGAKLASREDADVSQVIAEILTAEGAALRLDAQIARIARAGDNVIATLNDGTEIAGTHILFATGRIPSTARLRLDNVGVATDPDGYVSTDAKLLTNIPGIWALGDVNRRGAFTHTSYHDHEIVLAALDGLENLHQWRDVDRRPATYAMFTDPPLGRVGVSLKEAREMAGIGRAKEESETTGFIRLIVDGDTETLLGATVFGIGGDEIIAVLSNYMATGASYRIMQQALPVHPTVAEFLPTILAELQPLERASAGFEVQAVGETERL
jgi:pyruvate/2-oxoglutarate dehydrogenase complex dihydrolipoamide dehydrogenase (E3) component